MNAKAVFLDKDGTLIEDIPYNVDPDKIRLSVSSLEALRLLQDQGYQLIVVTNQSGVARGYFDETDLKQVEERLRDLLSSSGIVLSGFYYCPHYPDGKISKYAVVCGCRKPGTGMIDRATRERSLDRSQSWMVGDTLDDVEAGNRAGCRTILIGNDPPSRREAIVLRQPDFVAKDLQDAACRIALANPLPWDKRYGQ